jgi:hypothetical protein
LFTLADGNSSDITLLVAHLNAVSSVLGNAANGTAVALQVAVYNAQLASIQSTTLPAAYAAIASEYEVRVIGMSEC